MTKKRNVIEIIARPDCSYTCEECNVTKVFTNSKDRDHFGKLHIRYKHNGMFCPNAKMQIVENYNMITNMPDGKVEKVVMQTREQKYVLK